MATLQLTPDAAAARPDAEAFDPWTNRAVMLGLIPLLGWDAASVFKLSLAANVPWYLAVVPAISTSGIMLASSRIAARTSDNHTCTWAKRLAWFGLILGMVIAGIEHVLPDSATLTPHWSLLALIGVLPVAMGGCLYHVWTRGRQAHAHMLATRRDEQLAAIAQADQERQSKLEAELAAQREQEATERDRRLEVEHARELAELAERAADAAKRQIAAEATVANAANPGLHSVPNPVPTGATDALGRRARPSEKRDAALRWLLDQHRAGRDLSTVTGVEVDRAIGANAYAKKHLARWIPDVRAYAKRKAA